MPGPWEGKRDHLQGVALEMEKMDKLRAVDSGKYAAVSEDSYVRIEEDEMAAWLYLCPPGEGAPSYTKESILDYLKANRVVFGYHFSNISAMAKKKVFCREILVARGRVEEESTDGYYEYHFSPEKYRAPEIRVDGSVDYTSVSALQNVHAGDVVAEYHHAVQGENGCTVTGREIRSRLAKELPPMRGAGITNQEDPDIYVAVKDGKIELKDNRIDIQSVHEVTGDVDLITGKIEFFGDVIVGGNVESGVVIRAGRNIEIRGCVEAAVLYAGGDVIMSRGVQGAKKAKVNARGDVFADFIEHAAVEAGGSVQANSIINSRISAGEKVVLTGKKGVLIGGFTHGLQGVEATEIGNDAEMKTVVHVGCQPDTYEKYGRVKKQEVELQKKLSETVEEMSGILREIKRRREKLSAMTENRLMEMNKKKDMYFAGLDRIRKDKEILEKEINRGRGAQVVVDGNIYRGTVVCVEEVRMAIEHNTCYMRYGKSGGMVEGTVIIR